MIPDLPKKPSAKLTRIQHKAFDTMRELLTDSGESDRRYDALPDSKSGKIISTDIARYLDERYALKLAVGKSRDLAPGWDLAWRYAQDRLRREIESRGKRRLLRLMAGGWAAGKTHALRHEPTQTPDLIWDGTLKEREWAFATIQNALKHGWKIEVAYVHRDLELSLYGAVERWREVGRRVPLKELPKVHREVQRSVLDLTHLFLGEEEVSFLYLHNLGTKEVPVEARPVGLIELADRGALHYLPRHEQYYSEAAEAIVQGDEKGSRRAFEGGAKE